MENDASFETLKQLLTQVPGIQPWIGTGQLDGDGWYVKFGIDIRHKLAWNVIQEFGHILNYISINERLPTVFMPVSPPPYLNGGPDEYLSWVIECRDAAFTPGMAAEWLEGRLPRPVGDEGQWVANLPED